MTPVSEVDRMPAADTEAESKLMRVLDGLTDPDWWPDPPSQADREEVLRLLRRLPWWLRTKLLTVAAALRWLHAAIAWSEARDARRAARVTGAVGQARMKDRRR